MFRNYKVEVTSVFCGREKHVGHFSGEAWTTKEYQSVYTNNIHARLKEINSKRLRLTYADCRRNAKVIGLLPNTVHIGISGRYAKTMPCDYDMARAYVDAGR